MVHWCCVQLLNVVKLQIAQNVTKNGFMLRQVQSQCAERHQPILHKHLSIRSVNAASKNILARIEPTKAQ